jgi:putative PIN family toxin of toxin-antitoxin system
LRVVLDTNVVISSFLKPTGNPSRILRLILQGDLQIAINEQILAEYTEVASRPVFQLDRDKTEIVLGYLRSRAIQAPCLPVVPKLPDPSDEALLEAALSTNADFLITGNKKHYPARACKHVTVVTPAEFLKSLDSSSDS